MPQGLQPPDLFSATVGILFPVSFEYLPGGQKVQPNTSETPVVDENLPISQSMHESDSEVL